MRYGGQDDELVRNILGREITTLDRFTELFSTHPNIVKRIQALNNLY
jgi:Zn-dependent protease with chaperone function